MNNWTKLKPYVLRASVIALCVIALVSLARWVQAQTMKESLNEIAIDGPTEGLIHASHTFTATIDPGAMPPPITYTWEASAQSPRVIHSDALHSAQSFSWDTSGTKLITVTVSHGEDAVVTGTKMFSAKPYMIYLPLTFRRFSSIPSPMDLYAHVDDEFNHLLSSDRDAGDSTARAIYHTYPNFREAEFSMPLSADIMGTQYAYSISASENSTGSYHPATCDVEILLRRNGSDTVLASWPGAFTVNSTTKSYTSNLEGFDPEVQPGDTLVLRIRANDGSAMIWLRVAGYSRIRVPGYVP
jgi:hypothetical protein